MDSNQTQTQGDDAFRRSQRLSLEKTQPPTQVPGYEPQRFLGAGAYGEVWVAQDRNTGRLVAIKFYLHRGGLDWSLLSREVEKLVFLSADRYVVQLLDVGWDAEPPYYVMEFIEQGSLDDRLRQQGRLPVGEAVALFREVAIGLVHAHGRGVLHCDLKPANVLLDQDNRPRLADFGQSRLSHEQDPALGTLFYMAPEQANLQAVPDARWDVYALGALCYAMLTGEPPHRSPQAIEAMETAPELESRLQRYQKLITGDPPPSEHRKVHGVDRALAEILDQCLAADPAHRFPNPQAVVAALDAREARRARRPLLALGALGPILLLFVMGMAAWSGLNTAIRKSDAALTNRVLESNQFAAQAQAETVASELERRFRAVERVANHPEFIRLARENARDPDLLPLRAELNAVVPNNTEVEPVREVFRAHPARQPLQTWLEQLLADELEPSVASWFVNGPQGLQQARAPVQLTIGKNFAWRSYFQGGANDLPSDWRPQPGEHIRKTQLSTIFRSQATGRWIAGISTPIYDRANQNEFLGVVALTVEVGSFVNKLEQSNQQLAVLVDWRNGNTRGLILQHPLFAGLEKLPDRFVDYRLPADGFPVGGRDRQIDYRDPLAADPEGAALRGRWLAYAAPVLVRGHDSKLRVIVQETHRHAIGETLAELEESLLRIVVIALAGSAAVIVILWSFVMRTFGRDARAAIAVPTTEGPPGTATETSATVPDRDEEPLRG